MRTKGGGRHVGPSREGAHAARELSLERIVKSRVTKKRDPRTPQLPAGAGKRASALRPQDKWGDKGGIWAALQQRDKEEEENDKLLAKLRAQYAKQQEAEAEGVASDALLAHRGGVRGPGPLPESEDIGADLNVLAELASPLMVLAEHASLQKSKEEAAAAGLEDLLQAADHVAPKKDARTGARGGAAGAGRGRKGARATPTARKSASRASGAEARRGEGAYEEARPLLDRAAAAPPEQPKHRRKARPQRVVPLRRRLQLLGSTGAALRRLEAGDADEGLLDSPEGGEAGAECHARLSHALSVRTRRWARSEWLYSTIDRPWFQQNPLVQYLQYLDLGHVCRLTKAEWSMIRSSLGTPRRLSLRFLREERGRLELWRNRVRSAHREAWRSGSAAVLPPGVPPPLQVGQRVLALHPRTQQVHDGSILTRGQNEFRVQFDIEELGTEKVRDVDIVPWDPVEGVPLGLTVPGALTTPAVEAAQEGGATAARGATRQLDFSHGGGVAEVDAGVSVAGLRAKEAVRAAREEARQRLRKGAVKEKGAGGAGAGAASEAAMAVGGEALALVVAVKRCLSDPDALALSTHVLEQAMLEISRACTGAQVTGPVQEIAGLVSELKRLMAG